MKKLIVSIFALLLLIGGTANAQNQSTKTPEERAKLQADNIKIALVLNDEQNTKVYAVLLATTTQKDSLSTANPGNTSPEMKDLISAIDNARDVKIKAALKPDQASAYEAKKSELIGL